MKKINDFLQQRDVAWKFNPPAASHMGGIYERMIRAVRHVLKMVLHEQQISDEALVTALAEVEKILNDRPLTPLSDRPDDLQPLTPSHILLLKGNGSMPLGVFSKEEGYGRRRWRQAQYLANIFWRRWTREYLPSLQVRQKWNTERRNFSKGDLVLMASENTPRGQWPLGRILETFPDQKGHVRSVRLRTATGELVRPITCLCLLEGDGPSLESGQTNDEEQGSSEPQVQNQTNTEQQPQDQADAETQPLDWAHRIQNKVLPKRTTRGQKPRRLQDCA